MDYTKNALEARERALFGSTVTAVPRKTLLFHVPDRKAATLVPIIRKYVKPGTVVFSDKWAGYVSLGGTFQHFVVVHNRRFVKYNFMEDGLVMKVTTNHIERVWVEVRKTLRGVPMKDIDGRLQEVPYRTLKLGDKAHLDKLNVLVADMIRLTEKRQRTQRSSAFTW